MDPHWSFLILPIPLCFYIREYVTTVSDLIVPPSLIKKVKESIIVVMTYSTLTIDDLSLPSSLYEKIILPYAADFDTAGTALSLDQGPYTDIVNYFKLLRKYIIITGIILMLLFLFL